MLNPSGPLTFHYLTHIVYLAYSWESGSLEPIAYFLHREDCEKFCKSNNAIPGYQKSPDIEDSRWVNLMLSLPKKPGYRLYTSQRCTLQVPLGSK